MNNPDNYHQYNLLPYDAIPLLFSELQHLLEQRNPEHTPGEHEHSMEMSDFEEQDNDNPDSPSYSAEADDNYQDDSAHDSLTDNDESDKLPYLEIVMGNYNEDIQSPEQEDISDDDMANGDENKQVARELDFSEEASIVEMNGIRMSQFRLPPSTASLQELIAYKY